MYFVVDVVMDVVGDDGCDYVLYLDVDVVADVDVLATERLQNLIKATRSK